MSKSYAKQLIVPYCQLASPRSQKELIQMGKKQQFTKEKMKYCNNKSTNKLRLFKCHFCYGCQHSETKH